MNQTVETINIDDAKREFVDKNCELTNCKNRKYCYAEGYVCPAVCQLNSHISYE